MSIPEKNYFFSAMTPQQAEDNLSQLSSIQNLIVGGAAIGNSLEKALSNLACNCFATYGMTETVSHIALRKIGAEEYQILPEISISKDERECLKISAPKLLNEPITTNDLVEITSENSFIWKGRFDNVINSGGVKFTPETIERKIANLIDSPFFIIGVPDEKWGEKVVLVIEEKPFDPESLLSKIEKTLPKIQAPKQIIFSDEFKYTENGKLKRKETIALA